MAKQSRRLFLVSLLALLTSGCTPIKPSTDTFCQNAFDIGLGDGEHLNDANAKKVQAMDLYGEKQCGW